jgi:hypothetical protein
MCDLGGGLILRVKLRVGLPASLLKKSAVNGLRVGQSSLPAISPPEIMELILYLQFDHDHRFADHDICQSSFREITGRVARHI